MQLYEKMTPDEVDVIFWVSLSEREKREGLRRLIK
jgi:hypothetical protein